MSHELRTPLNSLLILAEQLSSNPEGNLTPKQVEFARTIRGSGKDLLKLINDILDLSKIESGTVTLDVGEVRFEEMRQTMERTFRHVAEGKGVSFKIDIDPSVPDAVRTDAQRLDQVLKNLLSNAFKFTERGYVNLQRRAGDGRLVAENRESQPRGKRPGVFGQRQRHRHSDGQTDDDLRAFQQADGSTSRKYGGTGLGLAISRELARVLGGEIRVESSEGRGSTFTLFLPQNYSAAARASGRWRGSCRSRIEQEAASNGETPVAPPMEFTLADDRANILPGEKSVLIIEDDRDFAQWLLDVARAKRIQSRGHAARENRARVGARIRAVRHHARSQPAGRGWLADSRPAEIRSGDAAHSRSSSSRRRRSRENALKQGALRFLTKPIDESQISADLREGARDE